MLYDSRICQMVLRPILMVLTYLCPTLPMTYEANFVHCYRGPLVSGFFLNLYFRFCKCILEIFSTATPSLFLPWPGPWQLPSVRHHMACLLLHLNPAPIWTCHFGWWMLLPSEFLLFLMLFVLLFFSLQRSYCISAGVSDRGWLS